MEPAASSKWSQRKSRMVSHRTATGTPTAMSPGTLPPHSLAPNNWRGARRGFGAIRMVAARAASRVGYAALVRGKVSPSFRSFYPRGTGDRLHSLLLFCTPDCQTSRSIDFLRCLLVLSIDRKGGSHQRSARGKRWRMDPPLPEEMVEWVLVIAKRGTRKKLPNRLA